MRKRDKSFGQKNETLEAREPGVLLLASNAAASEPGTEAAAPVEPTKAVAVKETDPERVAFAMWNEGRIDEAIEYLRGQIAAERDRLDSTALVPAGMGPGSEVGSATDWRDRHRSALAKGDFNAFGSTIHTIDIKATPADAIVAHPARRSRRGAWLMGVAALAIGLFAGAAYWNGGSGETEVAALSSVQPESAEPVEAADTAEAVAEPADAVEATDVELASVEPEDEAALLPDQDANAAATADAADEVEAPAPEIAPEIAELPPESEPAVETFQTPVAEVPPVELPPAAETPVLNATPEIPPADGIPPVELIEQPEMTASIEPAIEEASAPIIEPRLPRQRPEPPASFTQTASSDPLVIPEPDVSEIPVVGEPDRPTVYAGTEPQPLRVYRPIRRLLPGIGPVYDPNYPTTLTPEEYQALLERRAWAQRYSAERRQQAEDRVIFLP